MLHYLPSVANDLNRGAIAVYLGAGMRAMVFGSIFGLLFATAAVANDPVGTWQGYVHGERVDRPYIFGVTKDAQGRFAAVVIIAAPI